MESEKVARMRDYEKQLKKTQFNKNYSDQEQRFINNVINNPSLSVPYVRQKYPAFFQDCPNAPYQNKFKRNFTKKSFGSVLFASRIRKEDDSRKYENVKNNKFVQNSKLKMKWKTISWILQNKKDVLDRLIKFHHSILAGNIPDNEMDKNEFRRMMKINGITNDVDLINKLFFVFDEDYDNMLKFTEIAFGVEMFSDSNIEQKLKAFFALCDVDKSGTISKNEFTALMKKNVVNSEEKFGMKQIVERIFNSVQLNEDGEITL